MALKVNGDVSATSLDAARRLSSRRMVCSCKYARHSGQPDDAARAYTGLCQLFANR